MQIVKESLVDLIKVKETITTIQEKVRLLDETTVTSANIPTDSDLNVLLDKVKDDGIITVTQENGGIKTFQKVSDGTNATVVSDISSDSEINNTNINTSYFVEIARNYGNIITVALSQSLTNEEIYDAIIASDIRQGDVVFGISEEVYNSITNPVDTTPTV